MSKTAADHQSSGKLGLRFWLILLFFVMSTTSVLANQFAQMRSA